MDTVVRGLSSFRLLLVIALVLFLSNQFIYPQDRSSTSLTRDLSLFPQRHSDIWTEVYPLIPRVAYWGAEFINADTGWVTGEGGALLKTINGGAEWILKETSVENNIRCITSVGNGERLIAAGDGGIIIISEDLGESWSVIPSGTTQNLWNIQMITDNTGWLVGEGSRALKTTDGGLSWNQQPVPHSGLAYWDVSFIDTLFGYIGCNSGIVIKTTNGGSSWQILTTLDTRSIFTICAIDTLWAVAGGFVGKAVYTSNGGNTWSYSTGYISGDANKIKFIDSTTGYTASSGNITKSTDRGITWHKVFGGESNTMATNLSFPSQNTGYATGDPMLLLKTEDEGTSWSKTIINDEFLNVHFFDSKNGLLQTNRRIFLTADGGYSLDTLRTFPNNEIYGIGSLNFIDSNTGFIGTSSMTIYKTTDGGSTWNKQNVITSDTIGTIKKIYFQNNTTGWAITGNKIFKSTDGGASWYLNTTVGSSLNSIFFLNSLTGWTTNVQPRKPYKTTDGGNTWIEQTNLNFSLGTFDIFFKSNNEGFISGGFIPGYRLFKTGDGGLNWEIDSSVIDFNYARFSISTPEHFLITGSLAIRTTNGGVSWEMFPELGDIGYRAAFSFATDKLGFLAGAKGIIYKYFDESVPVENLQLEGRIDGNEFFLFWTTSTEVNNKGFIVQKKNNQNNWEDIDFIEGKGTSSEKTSYEFSEIINSAGVHYYRLRQIDFDGSSAYSNELTIEYNIPEEFRVYNNYPNPFNPTTTIRFDIPYEAETSIKLFDSLGRLVKVIEDKKYLPGNYELEISLPELPSGAYFCRINVKTIGGINLSKTNKLLLIK